MIMILAGTVEGKKTAVLLKQEGIPVIASVVSSYAADIMNKEETIETSQGNLDEKNLISFIKKKEVKILVDGTHPFASYISILAMKVAAELDIEYIRLERKSFVLPDNPLIKKINKLEQIDKYILPGQVVFSTIGSKKLPAIFPIIKKLGAHLVARVLPISEVVKQCENLGLNPDNIIALKGPFSKEFNRYQFEHYKAEIVLTKESGVAGGVDTKINAAIELGIPVLVWCRPKLNYPLVLNSPEAVVEYIKTNYGGLVDENI